MTPALPTLAVCGSGFPGAPPFSVALATASGTHVERSPSDGRGDLAVLTRRALAAAGIAARDLRTIRVDRGPGSYIGLRVAVTFARCLCAFGGAALDSADSLAVAALAAATVDPALAGRSLCPVLDGRQGRVQIGAYRTTPSGPMVTERVPTLLADADLVSWLRPGDAVLATPALIARLQAHAAAAQARLMPMPAWSADALLLPGLPCTAVAADAIEPLYLAGSYV